MSTHEPTKYVKCGRCEERVKLTTAIVSGDVEDPEKVVCSGCSEPSDRLV